MAHHVKRFARLWTLPWSCGPLIARRPAGAFWLVALALVAAGLLGQGIALAADEAATPLPTTAPTAPPESAEGSAPAPAAQAQPAAPAPLKEGDEVAHPEQAPRLVSQAPLDLPASLKTDLDYGEVVVQVLVDAKGRVPEAQVLKSEFKEEAVNNAVVKCVKKWRFEPAKHKGLKVSTRLEMTIPVQLAKHGKQVPESKRSWHPGD